LIPQNLQSSNNEESALQKFIRNFNPPEEQATSASNMSIKNRTKISSASFETHLREFHPFQQVQPICYASVYEQITPQAPTAIKKRSSITNMEGILPRKLSFEEKENDNQSDYLPISTFLTFSLTIKECLIVLLKKNNYV